MALESRSHNDYSVGWICALSKEQTAATAMLDQIHDLLEKPTNDQNAYTLGSIGKHNVVIACLPEGDIGTNSAANVVTQMVNTFPSIRFGLMVGIGGGIPSKVRLGDVVVSKPVGRFSRVIQWDRGKAENGGVFKHTGSLNGPPKALLTALTKLQTSHEMKGPKISQYLDELKTNWPRLASKYTRSDIHKDPLFELEGSQVGRSGLQIIFSILWGTIMAVFRFLLGQGTVASVEQHTTTSPAVEGQRKPGDICIHYGLIASGNQVIKDSAFRDKLDKDFGGQVLCVEMEAEGLMNNFPCLVIRGICDYADSNKNKDWQEYTAAIAAAYAKELLEFVQPSDVEGERRVKDILKQVHEEISVTRQNVTHIKSKLDKEEDKRVLDWLTMVDYGPQQSDYLSKRQPGTGQWLLESKEFQDWLATNKQTLFCPGIPGAGKTILTSIVIDDLDSRFHNDLGTGIAYIYFSYRRENEHNIEHLLASILKQLSEGQSSLPETTKDLYNRHSDKRTRPSLDEIRSALQTVVPLYSRVFVIIDALDECRTSCSKGFLSELFSLQENHGANIFATSRFIPEIMDCFNTRSSILTQEIRASTGDVTMYPEGHMERLPSLVQRNKQVQEEIKAEISKIVDGMFLLAQIYLNLLSDKLAINDIRSALQAFQRQSQSQGQGDDPKAQILSNAYDQAMERINKQMPGSRSLAMNTLLWITFAKRELKKEELQHALATRIGKPEFDRGDLPDAKDIVSICAGLVTLDQESGIVRLAHYTTQKYLEQTQGNWFPEGESPIMRICVTYLSFSEFEAGVCGTLEEFKKRKQLYPLYDYAATNWSHHAPIDTEPSEELIRFLESPVKVEASSQALLFSERVVYFTNAYQGPRGMTGLHLAGYCGVSNVTEKLLQLGHSANVEDSYDRTPLWWAVQKGHEVVVKLLLENGVDINARNKNGQTPLTWASQNEYDAGVKLLLNNGADVNARNVDGWTPLFYACWHGQEASVKLLLDNGADTNVGAADGRTPLLYTCWDGQEAIVKLLLDNGANTNIRDKEGRTPLLYTCLLGQEAIVKLLLDNSADTNVRDNEGWTPLSCAVERGFSGIVQLLNEAEKASIDVI